MMTIIVIVLVMSSALFHALWNAILKGRHNSTWSMTVMQLTTLALSAIALYFCPFPDRRSWSWLLAGAILHAGYRAALVRSFVFGQLGEVYPISRGAAPVLTSIGAIIAVNEYPSITGAMGIMLVSLGIAGIQSSGVRRLPLSALFAALVTAAFTASYTVVDGVGARLSGNAFSFTIWLFFLGSCGTLFWTLANGRMPMPTDDDKRDLIWAIVAGLLSMAGYAVIIWASSLGDVGAVAALRETSVVFAILFGRLFLNETIGLQRFSSCAIVALGCGLLAS